VERFILLALIGGAAAAVLVRLFVARVHRHLETAVELVPVQPRSVVHVLRTQDELEEAVRRAANFERRATDERRSRADRYEVMIARNAIVHIRGEQGLRPSDDQAHSA
jgi:hypothetical protein